MNGLSKIVIVNIDPLFGDSVKGPRDHIYRLGLLFSLSILITSAKHIIFHSPCTISLSYIVFIAHFYLTKLAWIVTMICMYMYLNSGQNALGQKVPDQKLATYLITSSRTI